jgi:hypothetical protein
MPLSEMAREVLAYLTAHPDEQDTVEGIAQWWSPQATIRYDRTVIEKALGELVREGVVIETNVRGASPLYRVTRRKRGD